MPAEQIGRLFQPFSQVDSSRTRKFSGTGLGLAICRRLVAMMGGEIWAESEPGKGSEFVFTARFGVGRNLPGMGAESGGQEDSPAWLLGRLAGRKLLLVEDNDFNQQFASELLTLAGAEITIADNGAVAVERAASMSFDAILMDLQMPVLDGYAATRQMRALPALDATPIIAMTAHALVEEKARCLALGMNDYVSKPIDPRHLLLVLGKWLPGSAPAQVPEPALPRGELDELPGQLPGIALELGLAFAAGRRAQYRKTLGRFLELKAGAAEAIREALAQGAFDTASNQAHAMIGSAGVIGAERLSSMARSFQIAIDSGDPGIIEAFRPRFEGDLEEVLDGLRAHFGQQG
jgi:CheY-like chemotaxis protein